jgi:hypothetical protein
MKPENSARNPAGYVSLHSTLYVLRVTQCQQSWHSRHPRHPNGVSTLCRHFVVNFDNLGILVTLVTFVTPNIVSTPCRHPRQPWHSRHSGHPRHPRRRVHTLKTLYRHCRDDGSPTIPGSLVPKFRFSITGALSLASHAPTVTSSLASHPRFLKQTRAHVQDICRYICYGERK